MAGSILWLKLLLPWLSPAHRFSESSTPRKPGELLHFHEFIGGVPAMANSRLTSPPRPLSGRRRAVRKGALTLATCLALADEVFAQAGTNPWTQAVQALQTAFTGPIATGLALVAIVVGGLMFAFGEGAAKRTLSGVIFGVGMAVGAVNFMSWLFP
jgi:type IV secretion system protein TrbC